MTVDSHDEIGVTVADMRNIIDAVKHLVSILLVQELALGIENFEWVVCIIQSHHRVEACLSLKHHMLNSFVVFFIE